MSAKSDKAKTALKSYFDQIKKGQSPWPTFADCLDFYNTDQFLLKSYKEKVSTDFLAEWGEAIAILNNNLKLAAAMSQLAAGTEKTKAPHPSAFFKALSNQAVTYTTVDFVRDAKEGLKDAGKAAATVAVVGGMAYLGWIAAASLIYLVFRKQVA